MKSVAGKGERGMALIVDEFSLISCAV